MNEKDMRDALRGMMNNWDKAVKVAEATGLDRARAVELVNNYIVEATR